MAFMLHSAAVDKCFGSSCPNLQCNNSNVVSFRDEWKKPSIIELCKSGWHEEPKRPNWIKNELSIARPHRDPVSEIPPEIDADEINFLGGQLGLPDGSTLNASGLAQPPNQRQIAQ
jgi:hypothetical protein